MNTRLFLAAVVATGLAACDKKPSTEAAAEEQRREQQRQADEKRIAELRELEQRAAEREAAEKAAEFEREREALAAERAQLERDRANLEDEQRRAADARLAKIRDDERRLEQRVAEERDAARRAAQEESRAEQTGDFFYDALEPHGDWIEVERYGYCWQPRAATDRGWRPYLDGKWVFTDYGWTWMSREPFGWATYHYGRWTRLRRLGWVWVPGTEWAPAWVAWRRGRDFVGWAPLPPEARSERGFSATVERDYDIGPGHYTFVSLESLDQPSYVGRAIEAERNVTVIQQTTNVTNITYQKVENRTVIRNEGPRLTEINQRMQIPRVELQRVKDSTAPVEQRGNVVRMKAPVIAPSAKTARRPGRVREKVAAPEVERGWNGVDPRALAEFREQQKKEAQAAAVQRPPQPAGIRPDRAPEIRKDAAESRPKPAAPPAGPEDSRKVSPPAAGKAETGPAAKPADGKPALTPPVGAKPSSPSSTREPAVKEEARPVGPPRPEREGGEGREPRQPDGRRANRPSPATEKTESSPATRAPKAAPAQPAAVPPGKPAPEPEKAPATNPEPNPATSPQPPNSQPNSPTRRESPAPPAPADRAGKAAPGVKPDDATREPGGQRGRPQRNAPREELRAVQQPSRESGGTPQKPAVQLEPANRTGRRPAGAAATAPAPPPSKEPAPADSPTPPPPNSDGAKNPAPGSDASASEDSNAAVDARPGRPAAERKGPADAKREGRKDEAERKRP